VRSTVLTEGRPTSFHANAPLTPAGRLRLVRRCQDRPIAHVAAEAGISQQCLSKWKARFDELGEVGLVDRASVLHRSPSQLAPDLVAQIKTWRRAHKWTARQITLELTRTGQMVSLATVSRWLVRSGINWRADECGSTQDKAAQRAKTTGAHAGYVYLHSAIDGYSRLAYTEHLPDGRAVTMIGFFHRGRAFFAAHGIHRLVRVVTDNGANHKATAFTRTVNAVASRHQRTRPHTPRHNDKIERHNRTLAEELLYARVWTCEAERAAAIQTWDIHYNFHRAHTAIGDRPPASRCYAGVTNVMSQNTQPWPEAPHERIVSTPSSLPYPARITTP